MHQSETQSTALMSSLSVHVYEYHPVNWCSWLFYADKEDS